MTLKPDAKWSNAEALLPKDLQPLLKKLREDYVTAARLHVPKWPGGPNADILAELIRQGWRK